MSNTLKTIIHHRWLDAAHTRRALTPASAQRLAQRVFESEQRHTGQVRICVEASLPLSYLWRHARHGQTMATLAHQRALSLFGKLRVWDTEHNNGVLIYLLLAERSIEFVADRGLNQALPPERWQAMVANLAADLQAGRFEQGLTLALDEVSQLLQRHFPASGDGSRRNELPNALVLL